MSNTQIKHILIVEDDEDEVHLLIRSFDLYEAEIKCTVVKDGKELMDYLVSGTRPDLILLDLYLPYIDGAKCAKEIRQNESYSGVPILFYSNSAPHNLSREALNFPDTYFFHKPNSIAEVELFVKSICSGKYLQISYSK